MVTRLEEGTYTRFGHDDGTVTEVFKVTEVGGAEQDPLTPGKYYYMYDGEPKGGPNGGYDTEDEALRAEAEGIGHAA